MGTKGQGRSWKVIEVQGRSRKVNQGHGSSLPITRLTFQVKKVIGGDGWVVVACRIILSAPVPVLSSGLWISDLGLGFGTGMGLTTTRLTKKISLVDNIF